MIEYNIKEEKRKEEQKIFDKWTRVALCIQSLWHGYKLRKNITKKKKNKAVKKNRVKKQTQIFRTFIQQLTNS